MRSNTATGTTATADPAGTAPRRGRFAPSPTGPLHLGSLLAAVGSFLDARAQGAEWIVRIEDVDRTREVPGAASGLLRTLEAFGLRWDGPVLYQSTRDEAYREALARLERDGRIYPCSCTRAEVALAGGPPAVYPGTCRDGLQRRDGPTAIRFRTAGSGVVEFEDRSQGWFRQEVEREVGDFVLRRRDGHWSYQLAVVVDDAFQGITDVVRGRDLLDNTPRQRLLQQALDLPPPRMLHLPLVVEADGTKLSKSRRALPVDPASAPRVLVEVLTLLRHPPPLELQQASVTDLLTWATSHWNIEKFQGVTNIISTE